MDNFSKPVRLQRKRTKGFSLQAAASNGLPVVYVGRPTRWGNPFASPNMSKARKAESFRSWLRTMPLLVAEAKNELRGKNLACWCGADEPCHADVWLEIANQ